VNSCAEQASRSRLKVQDAKLTASGFDKLTQLTLGALLLIPPLTVFFGCGLNGRCFILYREPKLVAVEFLAWLFLLVFFLRRRKAHAGAVFSEVLRLPEVLLFAAFTVYSLISSVWSLVPENAVYENQQWVLLFLLFVTLLTWTRLEGRDLTLRVESLLLTSMAIVTLISAFQVLGRLKFLLPVQPSNGVSHTSTMGYKNPLALAILCQIFLLIQRSLDPRRKALNRVLYSVVAIGELLLMASLGSRSALLGMMAGVLVAALILVVRLWARGGFRRIVVAVLVSAVSLTFILGLGAVFHRDRVASMIKIIGSPGAYLHTDRGIYFLNTLQMVRRHPFGVGAGNWQSVYPVSRKYEPQLAFDLNMQVRRAHSDPVRILGELGWPGLILWLSLLMSLTIHLIRRVLKERRGPRLLDLAQLAAIVVAGLTDYCLETPYLKFEIILVLFVLTSQFEPTTPPVEPRWAKQWGILRFLMITSAVFGMTYALCLGFKIEVSGQVRTLELLMSGRRPGPEELAETRRLEARLNRCPGYFKTLYRDHFLLAAIEFRAGNRMRAKAELARSLHLHPYHANAFLLAAELADTPEEAGRWKDLARKLLEGSLRPERADSRQIPPA